MNFKIQNLDFFFVIIIIFFIFKEDYLFNPCEILYCIFLRQLTGIIIAKASINEQRNHKVLYSIHLL